jgi:hypothetical protein
MVINRVFHKLTLMHNQQLLPKKFDNQIIGTQFF